MHALAWILLVWGAAPADSPDARSLGSTVAIYTTEQACIDAGIHKTTEDKAHRVAAHASGVRYRCVSLPMNPPLTQEYNERDYKSVTTQ